MTRKKTVPAQQKSYIDFLRGLKPVRISLVESHFSSNREQYLKEKVHQLSVLWKSETAESDGECLEVRAHVAVKVSAPKSSRVFFDLTATYLLHLHTPLPRRREHVARFSDSEARLMIWPYVREYVSGISGRMHVPPIVLPLTGSGEV
jgi:preprotein translocase subunit SecB